MNSNLLSITPQIFVEKLMKQTWHSANQTQLSKWSNFEWPEKIDPQEIQEDRIRSVM